MIGQFKLDLTDMLPRMLWKQASKQAFPLHGQEVIIRPLGPWIDNDRELWKWFCQPSTGRLYRRDNDQWKMYRHAS